LAIRRALIALLVALAAPWASAQAPGPETRIKAAFLYKFAEYVEWPANAFATAASPLVIGVADADPLALELESAVAGRQVAGRSVQVRRIGSADRMDDSLHVLFAGMAGGAARRAQVLAQAGAYPVLTVTDDGATHPRGSIINFVVVENRVRFDIARDHAERRGLQVGSQLLRVARNVVSP
jgi:hypothetical protein